MAIRYDKKLNQEINRTIKNFNQKIARLEKQERDLLPSKITKKSLKSNVYTRTELQRKLKELVEDLTDLNDRLNGADAISAMISAATDNAKELILAKINATNMSSFPFCNCFSRIIFR